MNTIRATDQKPFKSLVSKGMMTLARSQTFGIYGHFFKVPREQYASRTYKTIYVLWLQNSIPEIQPKVLKVIQFLPKNIHYKCYLY